ncbi:hypothetical protein DYB34_010933, partial [Aphanomyces astaci]
APRGVFNLTNVSVYICCLDEGPVAESHEEAGDKTVVQFLIGMETPQRRVFNDKEDVNYIGKNCAQSSP